MPDDLVEQINWVHEACEAMGVPILNAPGYEADDVIGTLAIRAAGDGFSVAIVSIDKDFFQLVHDGIRVYDPREDGAWFDEAGVVEKFGVRPSQVADVLALVGDTSDNVAGVPGIGKKGAVDLITQFGSLDSLLNRTPELKPKTREALSAHRGDALQSRELVTIRNDVNEYAPTADTIQKDYALVSSLTELDALIEELRAAGEFACRIIPDQP